MILITEEEIKAGIKLLAEQIYNDYKDEKELYVIYVLDGAFMFASDLVRELSKQNLKLIIGSLVIKTYDGMKSVKYPIIRPSFSFFLRKAAVLVVEDILDTGNTLNILIPAIKQQKPKSVDICILLKKSHNRCILKENINVKYIGFEIPDIFVIGYGLDYNEKYRELPFIREL